MHAPLPSEKALVPFVSVANMMRLVHAVGIERLLVELSDVIEDDFRRWDLFDKTPRIASHSKEGVIELMPTSDGEIYSFKICERPSEEHGSGPADRHCLWPAG